MKAQTLAIHGGYSCDSNSGAAAVPIYQTVSYAYKSAQKLADVYQGNAPGYIYTRIANPTTYALEQRLAEMEGGIGCVATSSGMAAITSVAMALLRAGDHILSASGVFGGTISLFKSTLGRFGVKTTLVDAGATDQFAREMNDKIKLIFIETIGNPRMDVPDIPAIADIAHKFNIPLILDSTVTTPFLIKGKDFGADIIILSTSKFINGHGTAIGGVVIDTGNYDWAKGVYEDIKELSKKVKKLAFLTHLRNLIYRDLGGCPAPLNSFLMLQGLETLSYRMEIHCRNSHRLAEFLQNHPKVAWVNYPGLSASSFYTRVANLFKGLGGGLLTFSLGDKQKAFKFIDSLKLVKNLANLGDAKTLVIHPSSTIFHQFSLIEQQKMGVTEDLIRVSVGIEDFEDIKNDFEQAIEKAWEERR